MARGILEKLRGAGLTVSREGGNLRVKPKHRLTEQIRAIIRTSKDELLTALEAERSANCRKQLALEDRVCTMAKRWGYSSDELSEALAGAKSDPKCWLLWTDRDEQDFGGCVNAEDFAARYTRLRGLA